MSFNRILPLPTPLDPSQGRLPIATRDTSHPVVFDEHGRRRSNVNMVSQNEEQHQDVVLEGGATRRDNTLSTSAAAHRGRSQASSSPAKAINVDEGISVQPERSSSVVSADSNVSQQFATQRFPSVPKGIGGWPGEPSQVCLCQPEPKVPRPRNGMFFPTSPFMPSSPIHPLKPVEPLADLSAIIQLSSSTVNTISPPSSLPTRTSLIPRSQR